MTHNPFLMVALLMSGMFLGAAISLAQDDVAADGEVQFNNSCRTCHSLKAGDNRLGPSLSGVVGAKSGSQEGFAYSGALKDGALTWDEATLDAFIANPDKVAPGHGMKPFAGVPEKTVRAKILSFLKSGGETAVD